MAAIAGSICGCFLVAEQATFAGMGIQPGYGDTWLLDAERATRVVGDLDHVHDTLLRHPSDGFGQGDVGGHVHDAQVGSDQQHADLFRLGAFGQQLGVPSVVESGREHGSLVQWGGDDGIDFAGHRHVAGSKDVFDRRFAARRRNLTPGAGGRIGVFQIDQGDGARLIDGGGWTAGVIDA